MKIKKAVAQLCMKQDVLTKVTYADDRHRQIAEALEANLSGLGGTANSIIAILSAVTGYELKVASKLHPMWTMAKDGNGAVCLCVSFESGASYGFLIPKDPAATMPGSYTQLNTNWITMRGAERKEWLDRFMGNCWKEDQIIEWVSTKLGGVHVSKFLKEVWEAMENA